MWQLIYGCLKVVSQTIDDFEEFKEKLSIDKCRILLNYGTRDLMPILRNNTDTMHEKQDNG